MITQPVKQTFRWKFRKNGKHVINICTKVFIYSGVTAALMTTAAPQALANPSGGTVTGGSATISESGSTLTVDQHSDRAIIEWDSFDISAGETTRFNQPNSGSVALNRVTTAGQVSYINGALSANGRLIVVNPNGVIIGKSGNIDAAGFVATTADMANDAFMSATDRFDFNIAGNDNGVVENSGTITVADAGLAALVAPTVRNDGIIQGRLAKVSLAGADMFAIDFYGDGLIQVAVDETKAGSRALSVENNGAIIADGGTIIMTAAAASDIVSSSINTSGVIKARSLVEKNGEIILTGAGADITVSGTVDVSADSSIDSDGGEIKVGGDYQGGGDLATAATVTTTDTAVLSADAGKNGDGGEIIVWADQTAIVRSEFSAQGGSESGDGGLVETSSKGDLDINGSTVNTLAANGEIGFWLLDPENIKIKDPGSVNYDETTHDDNSTTGTANIAVDSLNNATSHIILSASKTISFETDVNITQAGVNLYAVAGTSGSDISEIINGSSRSMTAGTGAITVTLSGGYIRTNGGDITFLSGDTITVNNSKLYSYGGDITLTGGAVTINNNAAVGSFGGDITLTAIAAGSGSSKTSGTVSTNSVYLDATNADASGIGGITLTENGSTISISDYGNPQNVFVQDSNGGAITIIGKTIGGNSVCFAAGGSGCLVTDPIATDLTITISDWNKIYGEDDPLYLSSGEVGDTYWSITSGSLESGDSLTIDLNRDTGENVGGGTGTGGTYAIFENGYTVSGDGLYNITFIDGSFTITPAALTVNATYQTKTYGDTDPALTYNVSGLKFSDTSGDVLSGVLTRDTGEDVGSYNITQGSLSTNSNYTINYTGNVLDITAKALTITALDDSKTYDGLAYSGGNGVSYDGFITGEDESDLTGGLTYGGDSQTAVNAGSYTITASGYSSGNYEITYKDGSLTIGKATLTVAADDKTMTYGGSLPSLTASYSGFVTGEDSSDLTTLASVTSGTAETADAGTYTDTLTASGAVADNYDFNYVAGDLTINKAALTVTAANDSKTYDGLAYDGGNGVTYSGFVNGDSANVLDDTNFAYGGSAQGATDAGSYTITASGYDADNYTISYNDGSLTIDQAALTITADNQSKTYGETFTFAGDEFSTTGLVNGETLTDASLSSAGEGATAGVNGSPYTITINNATGGTADLDNYDVTYTNGTLTVNKAALTVTAANDSKTYDGLAYDGGNGVTYSGFVNGDSANVLDDTNFAYGGSAQGATDAGSYTITASGYDADNYTISYVDGSLTIGKATLTVAADDKTMTYGGSLPSLTASYSGFVNGEDKSNLTTLASVTSGTAETADAGTYTDTLTASGAVADNYDFNYVAGDLTINKAALTVTAANDSKTYDGLAYSGGNGVTYSGFVNGDSASVLDDTSFAYGGSAQGTTDAGSYTITASGYDADNYTISYVDGSLTIGKATLTVAADDKTMTYGGSLPSLTASYSGFVTGEDSTDLTTLASVTSGTAETADAGTYTDTLTASGAVADNYDFNYVAGDLTINKAALTVTAANDSKTYDGLAYSGGNGVTYSGFVNGDSASVLDGTSFAYGGSAQGATDAGSYTITASGYDADNYTISYVDGALTIGKATLTVAADYKTKTYGESDPTLTYDVSGLAQGDTQSAVLSGGLGRYGGENVGNYYIYNNNLALISDNYTLNYTGNQLQITPATLTVTADPQTKLFGEADPEFTYEVSGLQFNDTAGDLLSGELTREPGEAIGNYEIEQGTLDLAANSNGPQPGFFRRAIYNQPNYTFQYIGNVLNIMPLPQAAPVSQPTTFVEIDPLNRPIISVANQALVNDAPFEPREVFELETDVSIGGNTGLANQLAGLAPAAGGQQNTGSDQSADQLAGIEPAAGGDSVETGQSTEVENRDIFCANAFLDNQPCDQVSE